MSKPILIIEDEAGIASALESVATSLGFVCEVAASAELGLALFRQREPALIVLDIGLPDRSGLEALSEIRAQDAEVPVVIITAHGKLQNALEAKRRGASAYVVKPIGLEAFESLLHEQLSSASDGGAACEEVESAAEESEASIDESPFLIGSSAAMQPAFAAIAHACASDASVLISGPTGIGKSLAARVIHANSARKDGPFVVLSCGSLPESLLEAELFGHEKGAFTGADVARAGHLERAAGGTLFLDEIGELSLAVQVKLLRFLDDRRFTRVGGRKDLRADLRVIAATHRELEELVREKRFREDLLYRLRVLELRLPPLRERREDLPALCSHLLARLGQGHVLSAGVVEVLARYDWPGNVRELRNVLEHAAAVAPGATILRTHLPSSFATPDEIADAAARKADASALDSALSAWLDEQLAGDASYAEIHRRIEQRLLDALLPRYGGKPTHLARALGMNRATLRRKLRTDEDG